MNLFKLFVVPSLVMTVNVFANPTEKELLEEARNTQKLYVSFNPRQPSFSDEDMDSLVKNGKDVLERYNEASFHGTELSSQSLQYFSSIKWSNLRNLSFYHNHIGNQGMK